MYVKYGSFLLVTSQNAPQPAVAIGAGPNPGEIELQMHYTGQRLENTLKGVARDFGFRMIRRLDDWKFS